MTQQEPPSTFSLDGLRLRMLAGCYFARGTDSSRGNLLRQRKQISPFRRTSSSVAFHAAGTACFDMWRERDREREREREREGGSFAAPTQGQTIFFQEVVFILASAFGKQVQRQLLTIGVAMDETFDEDIEQCKQSESLEQEFWHAHVRQGTPAPLLSHQQRGTKCAALSFFAVSCRWCRCDSRGLAGGIAVNCH